MSREGGSKRPPANDREGGGELSHWGSRPRRKVTQGVSRKLGDPSLAAAEATSCERISGKKNNAARGQVVAGKNDEKVRRRKRKRRSRFQEEEQELMAARGGSGR